MRKGRACSVATLIAGLGLVGGLSTGCQASRESTEVVGAGVAAGDPLGVAMMESISGRRVAVGHHSGGFLLPEAAGPSEIRTAGVATD